MPRTYQAQHNKRSGLPAGITETWRKREGRRDALEFQVFYQEEGRPRIKHFYVGPEPLGTQRKDAMARAIAFRQAYEEGCRPTE